MKIILTLNPDTHRLKQLWRSALLLVLLTLLCSFFPVAQAAPGDVDTSFAGFKFGGLARVSITRDMALLPNGKILVLFATENVNEFALIRFQSNGYLDRFNVNDEYVTFPNMFAPTAFAVQSDGSIVVAGGDGGFQLARITDVGGLDMSFDQDGRVQTPEAGGRLTSIQIQPDGKIVAVGTGNGGFSVVRYNPSGTRDNSFGGGDGQVTIGFRGRDFALDLALQSDGKIVVVGQDEKRYGFQDDDFAVARLNSDGTPDKSFDGDGKISTDFGHDEGAYAVAVQPDGKIIALGGTGANSSLLVRYMPNGHYDGTFGSGGKLVIPTDKLRDLVILPDKKIMLIGTHTSPDGDNKFALYRLLPSGAPDTTFNNGGIAWLNFYGDDRGTHLALLPDGRILAAGTQSNLLKLVRLWPDGTTLDTGGQQTHSVTFPPQYQPGYRETAYGMAFQRNNFLLVAGQVYNPEATVGDAFVTRFTPDGLPDLAFGSNGSAYIFGPGLFGAATAVAVQPDGKIVIAGYTAFNQEHTAMDFMVARFLPNGGIDYNFGTGGVTHVDFVGGADSATALALTPDGKIVVAGPIQGSRYVWGVARLTSSGQLDSSFNQGGWTYVDFPGNNGVNAVLVQPDRKIILGGYRESNGDSDFALARLTESGALDPSFGPTAQGIVTTQMGGRDRINALALAPNGFIYAGGYREIGGKRDFALVQYQFNGLRTNCAPGSTCANWPTGMYVSGLGGDDWINALALRADGQLVAAGCSEGHFGGVQVRTDGDPIPSQILFNTDFVGSPDCAKGVAFVGASSLIMAGDQDSYPFIGSDSNIALARFETTANTPGPAPTPMPNPNPTLSPVYLPIILR